MRLRRASNPAVRKLKLPRFWPASRNSQPGNALDLHPNSGGISVRQKPRHRCRMHIKKPCGFSGGFRSHCYHRNDFLLLLRSQLWTTSPDATPLASSIQSSHCSLFAPGVLPAGTRKMWEQAHLIGGVPETEVQARQGDFLESAGSRQPGSGQRPSGPFVRVKDSTFPRFARRADRARSRP
jgi:hypothetical protein